MENFKKLNRDEMKAISGGEQDCNVGEYVVCYDPPSGPDECYEVTSKMTPASFCDSLGLLNPPAYGACYTTYAACEAAI